MSSTTTNSIPTHTPLNSSPFDQNDGGGNTDFFGFLIAFAALLIVLMGCGMGSRRRFVARRRAMLAEVDPWAFVPPTRQPEPKYWEPPLTKGGDDWTMIMPLSVAVLHDIDAERGVPRRPRETPRNTSSFFPLSSWVPFIRANLGTSSRRKKPTEDPEACENEKPPNDLEVQVAVLIAMPSLPRPSNDDESAWERLAEYQIGAVRVRWEGGTT